MSSYSSRRLDGKVVIVTGSNSGIGESTALLFADKGAKVTLCGRNKDRLEAVKVKCGQISGHPERFISVSGDLSDPSVRAKTVEETVKTFGCLDILVANAGAANFPPKGYLEVKEEDWDRMVEILLKSALFLIQECLPHLEKTKGTICVVSSVAGLYCSPGLWDYSCMKASINQMVKVLAIPLGPKGVRINATCPSYVATNMLRAFGDQMQSVSDDFVQLAGQFHPLENRVSTIEEQSEAIAFLVSDESSYVTGEIVAVDGLACKVCPGWHHNYYLPNESEETNDY